ncbi:MAG: response regulator transcription factor [Planctomycetota bacterium]
MHRSPSGKDNNIDNSLFKRPTIVLLDERQWSYLQKRFHMSPRELQVARLICDGLNNEDIARALKIKHGTVKTHLRNIYRRVRVKNKITMLLKFVDAALKFSVKSKITPPIPIVGIKKPRKKTAAPTRTLKKEK